MIDPSSKLSLKVSCLRACDNDIERARELYAFLSEDLVDLPDAPSENIEKVKTGLSEVFSWVESHREDIAQGVQLIKSFRGGMSSVASAVTNVEPIPKI